MINSSEDRFNFFVPFSLEKSGEDGEMKIKGICSSNTRDSDGEYLDPSGFDYEPLLKEGFLNWEHQAGKTAGAIIGRPTSAKVINNGQDFYIEGLLYKGIEEARKIYNLAQVLEEEDPERRLGFSIEGTATERDHINPKKVKKAIITGIAITKCPKNPNTLLSIMKGNYDEPIVKADEISGEELGIKLKCQKCEAELLNNISTCGICGTVQKSMTTGNVPLPEDVEGKPKSQIEQDKIVSKSQVYNDIFKKYTCDVEKSKEIYNFIIQVQKKLDPTMADNNITKDAIKKAHELLDSSIDLTKGKETTDTTTVEPGAVKDELLKKAEEEKKEKEKKEKEDFEKAEKEKEEKSKMDDMKKAAKEHIDGAIKKATDEMVAKGYDMEKAGDTMNSVLSEYNSKKDGGDITAIDQVTKAIQLTTDKLEKSANGTNEALTQLSEILTTKFSALGKILLKQEADSDLIKSDLTKMSETIEKIGNEGVPRKSITKGGAAVREKFEKSEGAEGEADGVTVFSLSDRGHRVQLSNILEAEFEKSKSSGAPNGMLSAAIANLEISKTVQAPTLTFLKSKGVTVLQ